MSFLRKLFGFAPSPYAVEPAEAQRLVQQGATLVDVRTPAEFQGGSLPGAASIPLSELAHRLDEIPNDRPVVLFCRSGMRSGRAAKVLDGAGYTEVRNLGPMSAWPS